VDVTEIKRDLYSAIDKAFSRLIQIIKRRLSAKAFSSSWIAAECQLTTRGRTGMNAINQLDASSNEAEIDDGELAANSKANNNSNTGSSSAWSNVMFGTGMAAYLALPPMIPGVTTFDLIVFNVGLINAIYFIALVAQGIRVMKTKANRH